KVNFPELLRQLGERATVRYEGGGDHQVPGWNMEMGGETKGVDGNILSGNVAQPAHETNRRDRNVGIHPVNAHVLPAMSEHLTLKSYSRSTAKTYLTEMAQYLRTLSSHAADQVTVEMIRRYFVYCREKLKLSENTL